MTYRYRDPKLCDRYEPARPPVTVFRRSYIGPLMVELLGLLNDRSSEA